MSFGQTKEDILIRNITATYLVELILPGLTTIILSTVYQVMCQIKATTKPDPVTWGMNCCGTEKAMERKPQRAPIEEIWVRSLRVFLVF